MEMSSVSKMLQLLKLNYNREYTKQEAGLMVKLWYACLKDFDEKIIFLCLKDLFLSSKYPPQIADIVDLYHIKLGEIKNKGKIEKLTEDRKRIELENEEALKNGFVFHNPFKK